jgi:phospholipid/cholesterol/gamma-HCH transport system ATP-binding protein
MADDNQQPVVRCKNVTAGYGDVAILENINCEIYPGEIVTLLGGSGSGKSTLLKTMVGLLPPLSGTVEVLGRDLHSLDEHQRAEHLQRIGMMFQYGALFGSRTIYENISLPLREHTDVPEPVIREMVRMKLALVGLEGLDDRLPSDISGGQRKRVALVRSTILDPEVVFADEPSAGLDPVVAAGLDKVLRTYQRLFNMTMIVVTHELESIKILADRVIMLSDGDILTTGTVDELFDSEIEEVRDFFHRQPPDYLEAGSSASVLSELENS